MIILVDYKSTSRANACSAKTNVGGFDCFVARYDGTGNTLSAARYGGANDETAFAITANSAGDFFVSGSFNSASLVLGTISLSNSGNNDLFFAKYSSNGN